MIAKMKKVSLVGERNALKKIIDTLKATGNFQITFYKTTGTELSAADAATKKQLEAQLNRVNTVLNFFKVDNKQIAITYQTLKNITKKQNQIDKLLDRFEQAKIEINNRQAQINQNQNTINTLQPFQDLPLETTLLKNTRHTFVMAGLMTQNDLARFQNDLDLSRFIYQTFPTAHKMLLLVLTGQHEDYPIAETIKDYGWTPFPENQIYNRTPQAQIEHLLAKNQTLAAQIANLQQRYQPTAEQIQMLKIYDDYLRNELDTLEILTATIQTKSCFVIHGWLPEKLTKSFAAMIQKTNKNVVVEFKDAAATDTPPAAVHNTPLVAPYNAITMMYGAPGRNDLDPNPFVALFYFLFFGMMFGDLAYGLILSVVTALILIWKRPDGGTRQLLALFCMGGISAALWGVIFNSCFGLNLPSIVMPHTIIDPLGGDAILFFALSLYLGVIQILFGNLLNLLNQLRLRQWLNALCKALPNVVMFVGLVMAFPALMDLLLTLDYAFMAWFRPLLMPGLIITIVGFVMMVLGNGVGNGIGGYFLGMFSGAYKVVSYFSDILSYARLFGVGLVGCVIAYVANYLCGMMAGLGFIGIIIGGIIAILFHAINIALGLLSTYIHNARLQFVEFFGKFYQGTGTPFTPLCSKLRYTRIQNNARI